MAMVRCVLCDTWACTHELDRYNTDVRGQYVCADCNEEHYISTTTEEREEEDMNTGIEIQYYMSVDEIYDAMSEGQRCHMSNKLFKHGYRSPKATQGKVVKVDGVEYRLVRIGE